MIPHRLEEREHPTLFSDCSHFELEILQTHCRKDAFGGQTIANLGEPSA
jgi:hypothetical protein